MEANKYQELAARTIKRTLNHMEMENHALFGMASEIGELHGIFQKCYQGHTIVDEHMKKEVGDLLWFIAEFCTVHGWKLGDIMQMNIDKLIARYPIGFEEERSLNREAGDI